MTLRLPLLDVAAGTDVVAWRDGTAVTAASFLSQVTGLSASLPDADVINLCEDRYYFLVAYAAILCRGRTSLLPASRAEQALADLQAAYPRSHVIDDAAVARSAVSPLTVETAPTIPAEQIAAVLSTSGSTGQPKAHSKTWGELVGGARLLRRRLPFTGERAHVLATVPAQHMYGLETTVMLSLAGGVQIETSRPFFPGDIRARLQALATPRALITTPLHLKACLDSELDWPEVDFVLSSTAPMPIELARRAEAAFGAPLLEIYGSTETGALATRRPAVSLDWQPLEGVSVQPELDGSVARASHLKETVVLNDQVELHPDGRFTLLGRSADLIKIAGKRTSLAELNLKLNAIPGVKDGVFVLPDPDSKRLAALIVAPQLSAKDILEQLRRTLDPVFLPRPLFHVDKLPRNDTGKLPRQALLDLLRRLESMACPPNSNF